MGIHEHLFFDQGPPLPYPQKRSKLNKYLVNKT